MKLLSVKFSVNNLVRKSTADGSLMSFPDKIWCRFSSRQLNCFLKQQSRLLRVSST